ncbi:hypothetical protein SRABI128_03438 [Microbacterium sp. Bi128]|nr:hypothetical protein SRABI128_03438 [Microbacterium sp. Bi128]
MFDEFGLGRGARGEVQQERLVGQGGGVGGEIRTGRGSIRAVVLQGIGLGSGGVPGAGADLNQRVLAGDVGELRDVGTADGGPGRTAALHPVLEVGRSHQRGGGNHDDPQLDAGQHQFPELHLVAEHDDHPVPAPHTCPAQPVGHLGRAPGEVSEAAPGRGPVLFNDHQRRLIRLGRVRGELVEPVQGEVELLEAGPLEFVAGAVVVPAQGQQPVPCGPEFLSHGHGAPFEVLGRCRSGRAVARRRCLGSTGPARCLPSDPRHCAIY